MDCMASRLQNILRYNEIRQKHNTISADLSGRVATRLLGLWVRVPPGAWICNSTLQHCLPYV